MAFDFLDRQPPGARGLELGNVLSHCRSVQHEIVDKYERAPGVQNIDVGDLTTHDQFDFIAASRRSST